MMVAMMEILVAMMMAMALAMAMLMMHAMHFACAPVAFACMQHDTGATL